MRNYRKGELVKCVVTGIEKYGIFVTVDNSFDGLIHISEISSGFVRNVNDYVSINETINAKVIEVDGESHQLKLSIKDIDYRLKGHHEIDQSINGFKPLEEKLPIWTQENLNEMDE